jgi:glycosyltransferase involved in cell wall biosynthesis
MTGLRSGAGRIGDAKRQGLLIEALAHAPGVRLVVAGPPEDAAVPDALRALAQRCGVADRVSFDLRFRARGTGERWSMNVPRQPISL